MMSVFFFLGASILTPAMVQAACDDSPHKWNYKRVYADCTYTISGEGGTTLPIHVPILDAQWDLNFHSDGAVSITVSRASWDCNIGGHEECCTGTSCLGT